MTNAAMCRHGAVHIGIQQAFDAKFFHMLSKIHLLDMKQDEDIPYCCLKLMIRNKETNGTSTRTTTTHGASRSHPPPYTLSFEVSYPPFTFINNTTSRALVYILSVPSLLYTHCLCREEKGDMEITIHISRFRQLCALIVWMAGPSLQDLRSLN